MEDWNSPSLQKSKVLLISIVHLMFIDLIYLNNDYQFTS